MYKETSGSNGIKCITDMGRSDPFKVGRLMKCKMLFRIPTVSDQILEFLCIKTGFKWSRYYRAI